MLIGWDAADWQIINPLLDAGLMPALSGLTNEGVMGNIATLEPVISPILWSSIATGKFADKHGVLGFTEPLPMGQGIQPILSTSRKTKAIWNILMQNGYKTHVLGWWPSHPAEPLNGITVSNFYGRSSNPKPEKWKFPENSVHPPPYAELFNQFRIHPAELTHAHLLPFVPEAGKIDQKKDRSLYKIARAISEATNYHAIATWILENEDWDFIALYLNAIDIMCHQFIKYHPPKLKGIPGEQFDLYKDVVKASYMYHDMMLEQIIRLAGDQVTFILISDHGFISDERRLLANPHEPAGIAYDHRPFGIFCMKGPNIGQDERVYGASLLDVVPTILSVCELPIGKDMDGKPLIQVFKKEPKPKYIESWDNVEGNSGMHTDTNTTEHFTTKEELQQLIDLGYIEDPGEDVQLAVLSSGKESRFNLALVYLHSNRSRKAELLLKELVSEFPDEVRFLVRLVIAKQKLHDYEGSLQLIKKLRTLDVKLKKEIKDQKSQSKKKTRKAYQKVPLQTLNMLEGNIYMERNQFDSAIKLYNQVEKEMPYSARVNIQKGRALCLRLNFKEALSEYNKATDKDPDNPSAWTGIARCHFLMHNYEKTIDACLNAIGLLYYFPNAHYYLGMSLFQLQEYEHSAKALEVCLTQNPNIGKARNLLIKIYEEHLGDTSKAISHKAFFKNLSTEPIIVVSGIPRSGTSLMMQMLEATGIEIFTDGVRKADKNNPKGYNEHEIVKMLPKDTGWLSQAEGKAVKIISQLLFFLPDKYQYKIIFMKRNMKEVIHSQLTMIENSGKQKQSNTYPVELENAYIRNLQIIKQWAESKSNVEIEWIDYHDILSQKEDSFVRIRKLIDKPIQQNNMVKCIDPKLYRSKF